MSDDDRKDPMMSTMIIKPGERPAGFEYKTFAEFYPYYLGEHSNRTCRRLHFIGTSILWVLIAVGLVTTNWWLIPVAIVQAYAWAWVGHFGFEHNKPATFKYPLFSARGDWRMWWEMLTGKIAW